MKNVRPLLWVLAILDLPCMAVLAAILFVPLVVSQIVYGWLLGGGDLDGDGPLADNDQRQK